MISVDMVIVVSSWFILLSCMVWFLFMMLLCVWSGFVLLVVISLVCSLSCLEMSMFISEVRVSILSVLMLMLMNISMCLNGD